MRFQKLGMGGQTELSNAILFVLVLVFSIGILYVVLFNENDQGVGSAIQISPNPLCVNQMLIGTDTTAPYNVFWNTIGLEDGVYRITARAFDTSNNAGNSPQILVSVNNGTNFAGTQAPNEKKIGFKPAKSDSINFSHTNGSISNSNPDYIIYPSPDVHETFEPKRPVSKQPAQTISGTIANPVAQTSSLDPVITITSPTNGSVVSESVTILANVSVPDTDTTPPSVPVLSSLTSYSPNCRQMLLLWSTSSDNYGGTGVKGYKIYRNNEFIKNVYAPLLVIHDSELLPSTSYSYSISAFDFANNESARSPTISKTTQACTTPPTVPTGFTATSAGDCSQIVNVRWNPSTDNFANGVKGYKLYRNGVLVGTISIPAYIALTFGGDTGVPPGNHTYTVSAFDLEELESAQSTPATVSIPSCIDSTPPPAPTNLRVHSQPTCIGANFRWDPVNDIGGSGINGYHLYRNGELVNFYESLPGYTLPFNKSADYMRIPQSTFVYTLTAEDKAGNESLPSEPLTLTYPDCREYHPMGVTSIATLLMKFPDVENEPFTNIYADSLVYSGDPSLNSFFQEGSFNQQSISGQAFGWITMPRNITEYCPEPPLPDGLRYNCYYGQLEWDAYNTAIANGINLADYDKTQAVYSGVGSHGWSGFSGVVSAGYGELGFKIKTMAHELGHNIGPLSHNYKFTGCSNALVGPNFKNIYEGGCKIAVGAFDPISYEDPANLYHYSSVNKEILGYMLPENVVTADTDGEYIIDSLEVPSNGIKELRIPLGMEGMYILEYRQAVGFDLDIIDAVHIRLITMEDRIASGTNFLIDQFLNTDTAPFYDPFRDILVKVVSKSGNQATVSIKRNASDNSGSTASITSVEFFDGTNLIGTDFSPPYSFEWNTINATNGTHSLTARAFFDGSSTTSAPVNVTVSNSILVPPTVAIISPADGTIISGITTIDAVASHPSGINRLNFYYQPQTGTSILIGTDYTSPYSVQLNTNYLPTGPYTLTARAVDNSVPPNLGVSSPINVNVSNADNVSPTVYIISPVNGSVVLGNVNVSAIASDNAGINRVEFYQCLDNSFCFSNSDCSDGLFCNGTETCVNNSCTAGTLPCNAGQVCNESTNSCTSSSGSRKLGGGSPIG